MSEPIPVYPVAKQVPFKDTEHSAPGGVNERNLVVLHITEGTTAEGAIATFQSSKRAADGGTGLVSAHFIIDRDGTVYQLIPISATAWHASQANYHSIGIEHVAMSAQGAAWLSKVVGKVIPPSPCTELQYAASAALVAWLCNQMNVPIDRAHVQTHNEASPKDAHVLCCTGGLDPDKVVAMAAEVRS